MKKHEILYDWPIKQITHLTDSPEAGAYSEALGSHELDQFIALTEKMRSLVTGLNKAKEAQIHFTEWHNLRSYVGQFGQQFANFPGLSVDKLKISLLIAEKLYLSFLPFDMADIDVDAFELRELTHPVPLPWFCRQNGQSITDSVVIFSCVDHSAVEREIASSNISPDLLFNFMAALHQIESLPSSQAILIKKVEPQIEISALNAFARLVVLATGKPVHSARMYANLPSVLNPDEIRPGAPYQQWGEVLNVLSEYNSREEVLLKYLTIYHVIENFMFKRPIVELERQRNGGMFSIRDFRRLYEGVEMNETEALKKLFNAAFQMQALPGTSFQQHLITRWQGLVPTVSQADVNSALRTIGLNYSFNDFNGAGAPPLFSKLVYAIRNAIVHNKETEFHLTYVSIDAYPGLCALLEKFLLPSLEEICFALISKPNTEFWYQNKEIQLYK